MLLGSLVGCLGGDDDDDDGHSVVGVWYYADSPMNLKEDGTFVAEDGTTGTWSTDGDSLTVVTDGDTDTVLFAVEGDWLWLTKDRNGDCTAFAPESIDEDEWEDRVSEKTLPSICGSAH